MAKICPGPSHLLDVVGLEIWASTPVGRNWGGSLPLQEKLPTTGGVLLLLFTPPPPHVLEGRVLLLVQVKVQEQQSGLALVQTFTAGCHRGSRSALLT